MIEVAKVIPTVNIDDIAYDIYSHLLCPTGEVPTFNHFIGECSTFRDFWNEILEQGYVFTRKELCEIYFKACEYQIEALDENFECSKEDSPLWYAEHIADGGADYSTEAAWCKALVAKEKGMQMIIDEQKKWNEKSFKVSEIAEILKCSEQVVRREIKEGKMKAFRVGRNFRVSAVQLNEYMTDALEMEVKQ